MKLIRVKNGTQKKKDSGENFEDFEVGAEIEIALDKSVAALRLLTEARKIYNRFLGVNENNPNAKKEVAAVKLVLAEITSATKPLEKIK